MFSLLEPHDEKKNQDHCRCGRSERRSLGTQDRRVTQVPHYEACGAPTTTAWPQLHNAPLSLSSHLKWPFVGELQSWGKLQTFLVPLVKPKKMDFIRLCPVSTLLCQIASRSSTVLEEVNSNKNLAQQINFMYNLKESIAQKDLHWLL